MWTRHWELEHSFHEIRTTKRKSIHSVAEKSNQRIVERRACLGRSWHPEVWGCRTQLGMDQNLWNTIFWGGWTGWIDDPWISALLTSRRSNIASWGAMQTRTFPMPTSHSDSPRTGCGAVKSFLVTVVDLKILKRCMKHMTSHEPTLSNLVDFLYRNIRLITSFWSGEPGMLVMSSLCLVPCPWVLGNQRTMEVGSLEKVSLWK